MIEQSTAGPYRIMQRGIGFAVLGYCALLLVLLCPTTAIGGVRQDTLPPLPGHGVAGACVGAIGDTLVVAGGSWFPDGTDGSKAYEGGTSC